ncbi:melanocortin-2 receptor accessory protein 2A-like [Genypterus blacodes]|uniref:melanocortin-2 receptor accessory protein 2A-like n=1 Tax=Genypterus blacodes TaxID=154954 RepID=UPI003F763765
MSNFNHRNQTSARGSDYVWQYEYYDDEEPVSFEGLKAHRYSIVIGFWVGLAVFVIFMFFVLTLLTKTGAPHQETQDSAEKHNGAGSFVADSVHPEDENDKAFSRPLLGESRSFFHFNISEETQGKHKPEDRRFGEHTGARAQAACSRPAGIGSCGMEETREEDEEEEEVKARQLLGGAMEENKTDRDSDLLAHFNIPNFVNLEQGSMLGEEDLLYEPSIILERQSHLQDPFCDLY